MGTGDSHPFIKQTGVIPTYHDLFGREATLTELIAILKRYPVTVWLNYLARIQIVLSAQNLDDVERVQRVVAGTVSTDVEQRRQRFAASLGPQQRLSLYYERQLSTLQQLAILHAPEHGTGGFDTEEGCHDLSIALLMTMDVMTAGRSHDPELTQILPAIIQDQIRMSMTPAHTYAVRAFRFYQLASEARSDAVTMYLSLFEQAVGVNPVEYALGALALEIHESTRDLDKIGAAWHPVAHPKYCENPNEARVLAAYQGVRTLPLAELRKLIVRREHGRPVRDWNLIALSQAPICDLGDMGAFVLNHTALGRSLFDSIRHAVLTAVLDERLTGPHREKEAIGHLYGQIFETYAHQLLKEAFPDRVYRIPESNEQRADFLVWFPDKVVVIEAKSGHFVALRHASYLSLGERREDLRNMGIPNAMSQLRATICALRAGTIRPPGIPNYDWTTNAIVPLILTEERLPCVPGCWDTLYADLSSDLENLRAAGPLAHLRLVTLTEAERLSDIRGCEDAATLLWQWSENPQLTELTWGAFLQSQGIRYAHDSIDAHFVQMMQFLARRLGLDPSRIRLATDQCQ